MRVVIVGCGRVGGGLAAGLAATDAGHLEPADEVLALTTLQAEPDLRRLLGGQPGGSHTPAG